MTDADVIRDCALILQAAQDQLAKRLGSIGHAHARKDVEFSIRSLRDEIRTLGETADAITPDEIETHAELRERLGRMQRSAA